MKLNDLKSAIKIKWNSFDIVLESSSWDITTKFDVGPNDFLNFAKDDYITKDTKGLIGALSNSKYAIDCQVDWIISYLGYDYLNFNDKKYPQVKVLINDFETSIDVHKDSSIKLRFIQSLELAPIFLISKIRAIRNKLEHEYMLLNVSEVREAIEVAELFINATQNIIVNKLSNDCYFGNSYNEDNGTWLSPYAEVSFNPFHNDSNRLNIKWGYQSMELMPIDDGYIFFIKSMMTQDFSYLVKAFGDKIHKEYVKYTFKAF
ncbi:hypothetical protein SAMN05446037_105025 [Anaerovirgula multivorans]|uniref:Uncharacterized protein n=1 Tax=Anaerovirgula multivorans TaxID=312168 RepID=A0A239KP39_9FIRM|nr:hypothetical protein [Anaerovirgula multivorans]SNT19492.1 hypothetical protein SAMN05446037_105025 [Anaerovirgula multivorans]